MIELGTLPVSLTGEQRESLGALLQSAHEVDKIAHELSAQGLELAAQLLAGHAAKMAEDGCALAGVLVRPAGSLDVTYGIISYEVERHADRMWSVHLEARSEKVATHYFDGVSKSLAMALGLVSLAQTVLYGSNVRTRPRCGCGNAATCLGVYEDPQSAPQYGCDTCCGHGCEDGHCDPVTDSSLCLEEALDEELGTFCDRFEARMYASPRSEAAIERARQARRAALPAEPESSPPTEPEPSFHGTGPVD